MKQALAIAVFVPVFALGQPAFEAASIKPSPPGAAERSLTHRPGGRLVTANATLRMLILLAYQVLPFQLAGGPDWMESAGFDIDSTSSTRHGLLRSSASISAKPVRPGSRHTQIPKAPGHAYPIHDASARGRGTRPAIRKYP
jgi:hypothetical protein